MAANQEVAADSRYTNFPARLGKNPSEETLKQLFSQYGYVLVLSVTNNSSNNIQYYNPFSDSTGVLPPRKTDAIGAKGYLPMFGCSRKYEITYNLGTPQEFLMSVEGIDLFLLSFEQGAVVKDIRAVNPPAGAWEANLKLIINDNGYEIYDVLFDRLNSRIQFASSK